MKDNSSKDSAINEYFDLIDTKKNINSQKSEDASVKKSKTASKKGSGVPNKKKNSKRSPAFYTAVAVIIVLIIILTIFAVKAIRNSASDVLKGDWLYNVYYVYEFDGKGSGAMKITDGNTYKFSYAISDNLLSIDFDDYNVTDCEYTFTVEGDILTLVAVKGTVTVGAKYTLDRITE